jgi:hypothetical protein
MSPRPWTASAAVKDTVRKPIRGQAQGAPCHAASHVNVPNFDIAPGSNDGRPDPIVAAVDTSMRTERWRGNVCELVQRCIHNSLSHGWPAFRSPISVRRDPMAASVPNVRSHPWIARTRMNNGGIPNHGFAHWWTMLNPR